MRSYAIDGKPEKMNDSKEGGRFIRDKKGRIVCGRVPIGEKSMMRGVHDLNRGAQFPVKVYKSPFSSHVAIEDVEGEFDTDDVDECSCTNCSRDVDVKKGNERCPECKCVGCFIFRFQK